jgi:hypothetical protein
MQSIRSRMMSRGVLFLMVASLMAIAALGVAVAWALSRDTDSVSSANVATLSDQLRQARHEVQSLAVRERSVRHDVKELRQSFAASERSARRVEAAVVYFCQAYRSAKNFSESDYAVVVVHVLARACDQAKVPEQ